MPKMRTYGTTCQACKKSIVVGQIELPDNALLSELRHTLSERGWQGEKVRCDDQECKADNWCGPDNLIFLDYPKPPRL